MTGRKRNGRPTHRERRLELKFERERRQLLQEDVARALGVSASALSKFERRGKDLPYGKTEDDYLAALESAEGTSSAA